MRAEGNITKELYFLITLVPVKSKCRAYSFSKLFVSKVWAQKPECVREKAATDSISAICCDQNNDLAWVASRNGSLQIWHFDSALGSTGSAI